MKRKTILRAVAIAAIHGAALSTACGGSSPSQPSSESTPTPAPPSAPPPSPPPAPSPAPLTDQEFKDRLEALMLGTGPMRDPGGTGCITGKHIRWAETLATMRVVMSSRTTTRQREELMRIFQLYREMLGGRPNLQEEVVDVLPPELPIVGSPQVGMIRVDVLDDLVPVCFRVLAGCANPGGPESTYQGGTIWLRTGVPEGTASHEAGHMIGMCHIAGARSGDTIMYFSSTPTTLDRQVLEKVLRSGLRSGATRADFVAKGLL